VETLQEVVALGYDIECRCKPTIREFRLKIAIARALAYSIRPRCPGFLLEFFANSVGSTALGVAALFGHVPAIQLLLEARADVHATNLQKRTPLALAAMQGHEESVRTLLAAGSALHAVDGWGFTATGWAEARGHRGAARLLRQAGGEARGAAGCRFHGRAPVNLSRCNSLEKVEGAGNVSHEESTENVGDTTAPEESLLRELKMSL